MLKACCVLLTRLNVHQPSDLLRDMKARGVLSKIDGPLHSECRKRTTQPVRCTGHR